jgi:hypothetical protein
MMNAIDPTMVQPDASVPPLTSTSASIGRGRLRRWAAGIAFVAIWIGLGWWPGLDTNLYLLMGIPLTIVFQRSVRGEPLRAMWVREAPSMGKIWIIPAVVLAILPAVCLVEAIGVGYWIIAGWMLAAVVGSVGAGYALAHLRRSALRPFVMCQITAGLMGTGMMMAARTMAHVHRPVLSFHEGLRDFLLYFPVCFALEEVSFRGMLDSHLHRPGERFGLVSALLGSLLWGLWHLPTLPAEARDLNATVSLLVVHALIGVPLAIYWRQSGNLAVPAFTHALIDAVRHMMGLME